MNFSLTLSLLCLALALVACAKQRIPAINSYDPGLCNKKSHGKEVLVKDKVDDEIILICVKDKGVYQWKPTDAEECMMKTFSSPIKNLMKMLPGRKPLDERVRQAKDLIKTSSSPKS